MLLQTLTVLFLGNKFPAEKPTVVVRSVYNFHFKKPVTVTINTYSYSPRWKPEEMITKLFKDLTENIPKLRRQYNL